MTSEEKIIAYFQKQDRTIDNLVKSQKHTRWLVSALLAILCLIEIWLGLLTYLIVQIKYSRHISPASNVQIAPGKSEITAAITTVQKDERTIAIPADSIKSNFTGTSATAAVLLHHLHRTLPQPAIFCFPSGTPSGHRHNRADVLSPRR